MSGSGGGFGGPVGGGAPTVDCNSLAFETHIHSPIAAELVNLTVGMVLNIELAIMNGVELVRVTNQDNVVGGLTDQRIRACLRQEFRFIAHVREIDGALVKIFVEALGR